jgi:hypothetical protein
MAIINEINGRPSEEGENIDSNPQQALLPGQNGENIADANLYWLLATDISTQKQRRS